VSDGAGTAARLDRPVRRGFDGKGYTAGKSDTPWASSPPTCDFRFVANRREKIPTIRACGVGWLEYQWFPRVRETLE
jgi:hypothetical protein